MNEEIPRVECIVASTKQQLDQWEEIEQLQAAYDRTYQNHRGASAAQENTSRAVAEAKEAARGAESLRAKAEKSFILGRAGRVRKALQVGRAAQEKLTAAHASAGAAEARLIRSNARLSEAKQELSLALDRVAGMTSKESLEIQLDSAIGRLETLQAEIEALKAAAADFANELVSNAAVLFVTLTKLYTDRASLPEMTWDTVVIDEASMAMPPLVAYAAARARRRVVIVGGMYQLPPVVQSEPGSEGALLGTDVFGLRGITDAVEARQQFPSLAKLPVQRRMHPEIASVARDLIDIGYADLIDSLDLADRQLPVYANALGTACPLVTVDLSEFHPWSGKMPGSLSRFNFLSGQAAVELASIYATSLPRPDETAAPPIGIVTPYAAQRRYLNKLIQTLNLERWVTAGTVHTFQGNECDVIIFDSVLGEPHWTARLTNPHEFKEVRRDLNVAVTRARYQFVFVGDSRWLRKNAKLGSAYGKLWNHLEAHALHLDATQLLGDDFRQRVAATVSDIKAWSLPSDHSASLFTEMDFYPSFVGDLRNAKKRVVLYTPFIGKTRWPLVDPEIASLRERGIDVYLLHKPLTDPEWRRGDREFGQTVFDGLSAKGVKLISMSGVHAKTIVIDSNIVYDGSLNWASQTASYEHMWRFVSRDMAVLIEKMVQLEPIVDAYSQEKRGDRCPNCDGRLILINQAQQTQRDVYPVKLGCYNYATDKDICEGYLRRVDGRPPFAQPPVCDRGSVMRVHYTQAGRPWDWRCGHRGCKPIRWTRGDHLSDREFSPHTRRLF